MSPFTWVLVIAVLMFFGLWRIEVFARHSAEHEARDRAGETTKWREETTRSWRLTAERDAELREIDEALAGIYGVPLADLAYATRLDAIKGLRRKGRPPLRYFDAPAAMHEAVAMVPPHENAALDFIPTTEDAHDDRHHA